MIISFSMDKGTGFGSVAVASIDGHNSVMALRITRAQRNLRSRALTTLLSLNTTHLSEDMILKEIDNYTDNNIIYYLRKY